MSAEAAAVHGTSEQQEFIEVCNTLNVIRRSFLHRVRTGGSWRWW